FTLTALGSSDRLELLLKKPSATDAAVRGTPSQSTYIQRLLATVRSHPTEATSLYLSLAQGVNGLTVNVGQGPSVRLLEYPESRRSELEDKAAGWLPLTAGAEGIVCPYHVKAKGARPPAEGEVPTPTSVQEQLVQDDSGWELRQGVYAEATVRAGPV